MIYLDNAATTWPKPGSVIREVNSVLTGEFGNPGRGGHRMSVAAGEKIYDCRCAVAELFGSTEPENTVFCSGDTFALNMAIKALAVSGSEILISGIEHNSVLRPARALSTRGVSCKIYRADGGDESVLRDLRSKIKPETRIIVANHGSNICGIRLPIKKIGALCTEVNLSRSAVDRDGILHLRNPLFFIVDAAQTAGCEEISLERFGIDILCASGHKGLYGPQGCGFALLGGRAARNPELLSTIVEGGSGVGSREITMPQSLPERFEAGTLPMPAIAGLKKGIEFVRRVGIGEIREKGERLGRRMTEMLLSCKNTRVYYPEACSGTVLFGNTGIDSERIAAELDAHGICVRAGLHCSPLAHRTIGTPEDGAVRVSFGYFNKSSDPDDLYRVYRSLL